MGKVVVPGRIGALLLMFIRGHGCPSSLEFKIFLHVEHGNCAIISGYKRTTRGQSALTRAFQTEKAPRARGFQRGLTHAASGVLVGRCSLSLLTHYMVTAVAFGQRWGEMSQNQAKRKGTFGIACPLSRSPERFPRKRRPVPRRHQGGCRPPSGLDVCFVRP